jgi:hypothetical protein
MILINITMVLTERVNQRKDVCNKYCLVYSVQCTVYNAQLHTRGTWKENENE